MVDSFALGGVGGVVVNLVQRLDLLELFLLLLPIQCAEVVGALEHQVFQVVGEARGFRRVVLAAHAHRDVGLDARNVLVHGHKDLQTVVQRVVDDVHRVILIGLLVVILRERAEGQETAGRQQQSCDKVTFHFFTVLEIPGFESAKIHIFTTHRRVFISLMIFLFQYCVWGV